MVFSPFPSTDDITVAYLERCVELRQDINNLLPPWARQNADRLFHGRKLIICGIRSRPELRVLARHTEVIGVVDDAATGGIFTIPIIHSDTWIEWAKNDPNVLTCILAQDGKTYRHFVRQCIEHGIPYLDPLQTMYAIRLHKIDTRGEAGLWFMYGLPFFDFVLENHERLFELGARLEDSYSRFSWLCMLMHRLTLDPFYPDLCSVGMNLDRYGLDTYQLCRNFLQFSDREIYVDGGAWTGDSIEHFLKAVNGKFTHIYAFEPLAAHNRALRLRLNEAQEHYLDSFADKISFIRKGLWDSDGVLHFNALQTHRQTKAFDAGAQDVTPSAHFVESDMTRHLYEKTGAIQPARILPVTSIDLATNLDATYIKYEIEGSELKALQGSVKTLERNRPKIALSLYHKPEDYLTLTEFMIGTRLGYRFGFRHHHTESLPEASVLYCYT